MIITTTTTTKTNKEEKDDDDDDDYDSLPVCYITKDDCRIELKFRYTFYHIRIYRAIGHVLLVLFIMRIISL